MMDTRLLSLVQGPSVAEVDSHPRHQGEDAVTPPRPMNPALVNANIEPTTMEGVTIMATNDVNCSPSP
jgi:hypothetical protein